MSLWVGIDEAGYGPRLGPLVVARVAIRTADAAGHGLPRIPGVGDSKAIYRGRGDLARLEAPVLGLFRTFGHNPTRTWDVARGIGGGPLDTTRYPWYGGETLDTLVPLAARPEAVEAAFRSMRCLAASPLACVTDVARFNAHCGGPHGKAGLLVLSAWYLLHDLWELEPEATIVFDKHGGRNRYAEVLGAILPGAAVTPVEEGRLRSVYEVLAPGRRWRVTFAARADATDQAVGLASMVAKYVREVHMAMFNAFWAREVPGLRPTAGYPQDATRFLREIEPARARLGIDPAILVRDR